VYKRRHTKSVAIIKKHISPIKKKNIITLIFLITFIQTQKTLFFVNLPKDGSQDVTQLSKGGVNCAT